MTRLDSSTFLYRRFIVENAGRFFVVEWRGGEIGSEHVYVDGQKAAGGRSLKWFLPRFLFELGDAVAVLEVRVWPWLALRWLRLKIDGEVEYEEGSFTSSR